MIGTILCALSCANFSEVIHKNGNHFVIVQFLKNESGLHMRQHIQHSKIVQVYNRKFKAQKAIKDTESVKKEFEIFVDALKRGLSVTQNHPNTLYSKCFIEEVKVYCALLCDNALFGTDTVSSNKQKMIG